MLLNSLKFTRMRSCIPLIKIKITYAKLFSKTNPPKKDGNRYNNELNKLVDLQRSM
jgi:hypothetical protein